MIVLEQYLVIVSDKNPDGVHLIKVSEKKWKNEMKGVDDLYSQEGAHNFLTKLKIKDKLLPVETEFGEPFVYNLFVRGRSSAMPYLLDKNGKPAPYYNFYPGYDNNMKKLDLFPNGAL